MALYSYQGERPAPLPERIELPDGFSRTDSSTYTAEELAAWGYTGPHEEPAYDPGTEVLEWDGEAFSVRPMTAEEETAHYNAQADWLGFSEALLTSPAFIRARAGAAERTNVMAAYSDLGWQLDRASVGLVNVPAMNVCWSNLLAALTDEFALTATQRSDLETLIAQYHLDRLITLPAG